MKISEINARGKDCPQPVIMTKNAVSDGADELVVIVDNAIAAANVGRFLAKNGFSSKEERSQSGDIFIKGSRESVTLPTSEQKQSGGSHSGGYVVLFTRSVIGGEDKELGEVLAKAYLGALSQVRVPESIILMNEGAKLAIPGSSSCEHLKVLGELGTDILVCGTCVKHFGIDVGVGTISNMLDIAEVIASAEHVVSF